MVKVASIGANDETDGAKIWIGYERAEKDGKKGWRVVASNGDDIGYYTPQTKKKCIEDIYAMYDRWDSFQEAKIEQDRKEKALENLNQTLKEALLKAEGR